MKQLLDIYEEASRQKLNMQKALIYFSTNTRTNVRDKLVHDIGARECEDVGKCLSLATMVGRSKYKAFKGINERYVV